MQNGENEAIDGSHLPSSKSINKKFKKHKIHKVKNDFSDSIARKSFKSIKSRYDDDSDDTSSSSSSSNSNSIDIKTLKMKKITPIERLNKIKSEMIELEHDLNNEEDHKRDEDILTELLNYRTKLGDIELRFENRGKENEDINKKVINDDTVLIDNERILEIDKRLNILEKVIGANNVSLTYDVSVPFLKEFQINYTIN